MEDEADDEEDDGGFVEISIDVFLIFLEAFLIFMVSSKTSLKSM